MPQITASAPGKLLLFGDHAVVYGHPCIVTAVDQRVRVTVKKNGLDVLHLDAPDVGLQAYSKTIADLGKKELPKGVAFIEMLYKRFLEKYPQKEGIIVTTQSEFSSKFGFGSSSAVTVAFAKALLTLYEIEADNEELFQLCYQAILDVQGVGSGFDVASAIWGGTIYYIKPAKVVRQIPLTDLPLVVGYTGIKADTPTLVRMVENTYKNEPKRIEEIFQRIADITELALTAISGHRWEDVGKLMTESQQLLRKLQVSSIQLERLITATQKAGALGAKLSGAGGGDCMIALAEETQKEKVIQSLKDAGAQVMDVILNAPGVRIEAS
jgi:mevalonate kinase